MTGKSNKASCILIEVLPFRMHVFKSVLYKRGLGPEFVLNELQGRTTNSAVAGGTFNKLLVIIGCSRASFSYL